MSLCCLLCCAVNTLQEVDAVLSQHIHELERSFKQSLDSRHLSSLAAAAAATAAGGGPGSSSGPAGGGVGGPGGARGLTLPAPGAAGSWQVCALRTLGEATEWMYIYIASLGRLIGQRYSRGLLGSDRVQGDNALTGVPKLSVAASNTAPLNTLGLCMGAQGQAMELPSPLAQGHGDSCCYVQCT